MELKKGHTIMMAVDLQMRAEIFQEAISNRAGLPHDKFALYYQSKQIEGEAMLRSYGIGKDATIEVKFRGRGGMPMGGDDPAPKGGLRDREASSSEEDESKEDEDEDTDKDEDEGHLKVRPVPGSSEVPKGLFNAVPQRERESPKIKQLYPMGTSWPKEDAPRHWGMTLREFNQFIDACKATDLWDKVKHFSTNDPTISNDKQIKHVWDPTTKALKYVKSVSAHDINTYFVQ